MTNQKLQLRKRRHTKIRKTVSGTEARPRLVVFRSQNYIYAQVIDDKKGATLASSSDLQIKLKGTKTEKAFEIGKKIAELAKAKKVEQVAFDRNGYKFHGRVKAVAEGAREGGLQF